MRDFPRLYIDDLLEIGVKFTLSKEHCHYLNHVMRRKLNDKIMVFNGKNGEFIAQICEISKKSIEIEIIEQTRIQSILPEITLYFAPIKGHRNDNIIEKATEIGIKNIVPIITERTIIRKPNIEKYLSIAIEAAEQCESLNIPNINQENNLIDAVLNSQANIIFFADEAGGGKSLASCLSFNFQNIALLIGPEGGFSQNEREKLLSIDKICPISLGPRILRADTAAISGLCLLQTFWGDWQC